MFSKGRGFIKRSFCFLFIFLFVISLFPTTAFSDTRVEIFGYVRDDDTGDSIYNARVDLFYDNESVPFISTYSDNNGLIDTTIYASETIGRVEIARSGYNREVYTISNYSSSIDLGTKYLTPGSSSTTGTYRVYGTVLDDNDDDYISDARVVLVENYEGITYVGYTNSRGNFDVINLPLGDYEVRITKYGYEDYEKSTLLRLRTGDYDMGTITLQNTDGSSSSSSEKLLTGRVTDENGYYVQNAEVYLIDQDEEEIKTTTDSRGYYTFRNVEVGTYTIGVDASGYELLERINYARILSGDTEKEINLVVRTESRTGYDVYGRLVDEDGNYIEAAEVSLIDGNTRIKKVSTDSRGYYEIRYVENGIYTIEFKKIGYQTKTLSDEVRINGNYYSVSQTELKESQGISVVLGGLVGDSQSGLRNISVYLENDNDTYTVKTNYYGYFTFNEVREGTYNIYAVINNQKKLLETNLRISGTRIEVGDINVNRVDSGYVIAGNIKDTNNYNINGVAVILTSTGTRKETTTNTNGNYTFSGIERGDYTISLSKEGYGTITEEFAITSYDLQKDYTLRPNDYVKVTSSEIALAVNEKVSLNKFITKAEIFSSRNVLLDTISSSYEVSVPENYTEYLTVNSSNEITGKKAGTAYIDVSIRNSRDYDNLSPARIKVTINSAAREAILTIGSNYYILDGKTETSDAVPYIKNDRSFFPIRVIAKVLGVTDANIKWDSITQTATLIKGTDTVEFIVGKEYYKQNGVMIYMDVKPENISGRVYLPARYVSDALGGDIEWNNFTKSLTIKSN